MAHHHERTRVSPIARLPISSNQYEIQAQRHEFWRRLSQYSDWIQYPLDACVYLIAAHDVTVIKLRVSIVGSLLAFGIYYRPSKSSCAALMIIRANLLTACPCDQLSSRIWRQKVVVRISDKSTSNSVS